MRRVGRTLQVLVQWKGLHADQWLTWAQYNQGTKTEAKEMDRIYASFRPGRVPRGRGLTKGCGGSLAPPERGGEPAAGQA